MMLLFTIDMSFMKLTLSWYIDVLYGILKLFLRIDTLYEGDFVKSLIAFIRWSDDETPEKYELSVDSNLNSTTGNNNNPRIKAEVNTFLATNRSSRFR
jgi:hypothetical protein